MELPWRLFAGIIIVWLLAGFVPLLVEGELHAAADFANTFGFVNALFAALAFGGVIWAIRLQTKELELQRHEVEETRDELRRSADAQHQMQQMHFLSALLVARNNVAQGYAAAAARESGPLQSSQIAHRQLLAELEWLLERVDRHESNPFSLPTPSIIIAHQVALLVKRAYPVLQSALNHRATNHARSILLDMNQSLRELRRLLVADQVEACELSVMLDRCIPRAETVSNCCEFDEVAEICHSAFNDVSSHVASSLGVLLPTLAPRSDRPAMDGRPGMATS